MTAIRFAASIVLGLVATTSAFAAEPEAATTVAAAATTAVAAKAAPVGPSSTTRYCIKSQVTGSRIDRALCDTRGNWMAQGVDIDAMIATRRR